MVCFTSAFHPPVVTFCACLFVYLRLSYHSFHRSPISLAQYTLCQSLPVTTISLYCDWKSSRSCMHVLNIIFIH